MVGVLPGAVSTELCFSLHHVAKGLLTPVSFLWPCRCWWVPDHPGGLPRRHDVCQPKWRVFVHPPNEPRVPRALLQPLLEPLLRFLPSSCTPAVSSKLPHHLQASHMPLWIPDGWKQPVCGWVAQRPRLPLHWQSHVPAHQVQPKVVSRKPLCLCLFSSMYSSIYLTYHLCIYYLPIYLLIVSIIYLFEDQAHVFSLFNNKYIVKHTKWIRERI